MRTASVGSGAIIPAGEVDFDSGVQRSGRGGLRALVLGRAWNDLTMILLPPGGARFRSPIRGARVGHEERAQCDDGWGAQVRLFFQAAQEELFQFGTDRIGGAPARRRRAFGQVLLVKVDD